MRYSQRSSDASGLLRQAEDAEPGWRATTAGDGVRRRRLAWARREHAGNSSTPRASGGPHRALAWSASARVIEQQRILRGWTRRQLAQAANVDPKTLGDFIVGRRRPQLGTVQALCVALGLRLADVIVFPEVPDQAAGS